MLLAIFKMLVVLGVGALFVFRAVKGVTIKRNSYGSIESIDFGKGFAKNVVLAVTAMFLIGAFLSAFVVIPAGHRGVVFSQTAGVEKRVLNEGISFVIPMIESVHDYNVQRSTMELKLGKGNAAASSDVQDVFVGVKVTYRPIPDRVNTTWQEVGDRETLEAKILSPETIQVLKAVIPRYAAADIVTKREDIREKALQLLNEREVVDRYVEILSISLSNVEFQQDFRTLLEQKAQKTQQLEIAKREVEIAEQAKLKKIKEAEGESQSTKTKADGVAYQNKVLAASVTPKTLEARRLDVAETLANKWTGEYPDTWLNMGGGGSAALPIMNIDALIGQLQAAPAK